MSRHPLSANRKAAFIAELARHGIAMRAARAASPHTETGALSTFQDERQRDPAFAAAWDDAVEVARADVEHEIYRRSTEGYEEPVFGGRYRETVVGTVRRYSDRLLELRARALLPAYRDGVPFSINNRGTYELDAGLLGDAVTSVAMQLVHSLEPKSLNVIEGRATDDV